MSKSRAGKTPGANQNAPPAATQNAIVPGKFMESDWNELLEIEDDEWFISDIIDEISEAACNKVFENIVKSRVQPHTVLAARELLLDIIEWQFLQSDPGEQKIKDTSWMEDEEPGDCVIDNWAQGAVPVAKEYKSTCKGGSLFEGIEESSEESSIHESMEDIFPENGIITDGCIIINSQNNEDVVDTDIPKENIQPDAVRTDGSAHYSSNDLNNSLEESVGKINEVKHLNKSPGSQPESKKRTITSKKYRPYGGSLPKFQKIPLESVTDLRPKPGTVPTKSVLSYTPMTPELLVRTQYGRISGPTEVVYDGKGTVVKVQKLNVQNFPNHRIPVKYSILDNAEENDKKLHFNSNSRYKNSKENVEKTIRNKDKISAKKLLQKVHHICTWEQSSISSAGNKNTELNMSPTTPWELRSPLPPLMVDAMNLTDGVTIREGGLSKQVVKKSAQLFTGKRSIQPIHSTANIVLDVKDIVSESSPGFRYTATLEPLTGM